MRSRQSGRSLLGALVALAGAAAAWADAPPAPVTVAYGSLAFAPCTLAQAGQAQTVPARCATLQVPEDRSSANGRKIELALAWVPSTARSPVNDPVVMLAGGQWTRSPFERMVKAGVAVVLLNRVPDWTAGLRQDHPRALVASVAPRQEKIGEIQGHQAQRLEPAGGFVLLVTGDASSPAAVARRRGFLEATAGRFAVHDVDGRWSVAGAEKAMGEWFRVGAERERPLALVVCQNDAMARGARAALGGALATVVAWLPFLADGGHAAYLRNIAAYQDGVFAVMSLRAWNPWWILQSTAAGDAFPLG